MSYATSKRLVAAVLGLVALAAAVTIAPRPASAVTGDSTLEITGSMFTGINANVPGDLLTCNGRGERVSAGFWYSDDDTTNGYPTYTNGCLASLSYPSGSSILIGMRFNSVLTVDGSGATLVIQDLRYDYGNVGTGVYESIPDDCTLYVDENIELESTDFTTSTYAGTFTHDGPITEFSSPDCGDWDWVIEYIIDTYGLDFDWEAELVLD